MGESWIVSNLNAALSTWNDKLAEIWSLLTESPQTFKDGQVWGVMTGIHGALQAIGYGLLVLFFAVGVMKTCGSFVEVKKPEHALKLFIRFALAKGAVTYGLELMLAVFSIVQGMVSTIITQSGSSGMSSVSLPQELIDAINNVGFWDSIPLWAVTLIGGLLITVLSFTMILTVYGRMFSLWMYAAIAPIPQNVNAIYILQYLLSLLFERPLKKMKKGELKMAYEFNHYYEIQNVATGKYVNVLGNHEDGTVKNGETVNLFNRTNNPDQRWALENFGGNGNVRIVLQRGEGWYALNYNTRNTNCIVWHLNTADDTDTVITTVEVENRPNTYYLMLRDRSIYLTAVGTALKWSAYTGEEEQMFTILKPGTGSDGSDSGEVSNVPDSKLVTKFIPAYEGNYTKDRKAQGGTISEITIHHCASILTIDALGALWQREGRKGSSHYGVSETNIGQYVHESDVAWTNGNWEANCRAVTIETSNSGGAPEWPVSDTTFQTLVTLVADIARRNGLGKLVKGKNLTWHSMYAATACPGPYLSGKLQELVDKANTINGF